MNNKIIIDEYTKTVDVNNIDPRNIEQLKQFFEEYKYYSTFQLMHIANRSHYTIRRWKNLVGIKNDNMNVGQSRYFNRKKKEVKKTENIRITREKWDNREWFYEQYVKKGYGMYIISKMLGISTERVFAYLKKYGIQSRSLKESTKSKNKYCNKDWLLENYIVKELTIPQCAKKAKVPQVVLAQWLARFGIPIRNVGETRAVRRDKEFSDDFEIYTLIDAGWDRKKIAYSRENKKINR